MWSVSLSAALAAVLVSSGVNALSIPRNGPVNFTSPVYLINSVASPQYRIGVAYESKLPFPPAPIPVITLPADQAIAENNRWAVGILPDGNYHLHVVAFNGAIKPNKGVYAVPPTLTWPEEFIITSYGANDTFKIEATDESGAWTIGELGDQLTSKPFEGTPTQLFYIVPYPVASVIAEGF